MNLTLKYLCKKFRKSDSFMRTTLSRFEFNKYTIPLRRWEFENSPDFLAQLQRYITVREGRYAKRY